MSGLVRGSLEEALSAALLERGVRAEPELVEPLVGAVADWAAVLAHDEDRAVRRVVGNVTVGLRPLLPYWSGRTLEGLATMLRSRL